MSTTARCLAVLLIVGCAKILAAAEGDTAKKSLVTIEVSIVDVPANGDQAAGVDAGASERFIARIRELEARGLLQGVTRLRLATLEENPANVQIGERSPVVTEWNAAGVRGNRGQQFGAAAAAANLFPGQFPGQATAVSYQQSGTLLSATPRVEDGGTIVVDLQIERTATTREPKREPAPNANAEAPAPGGAGAPAAAPPAPAPKFLTTTVKSTVRVANGQSVIVHGLGSSAEKDAGQTVMVLTAHADPPAKAAAGDDKASREKILRVMTLKSVGAASVPAILSELFPNTLKIGVEPRSNSVVLRGMPNDVELAVTILARLDGLPDAAASDK